MSDKHLDPTSRYSAGDLLKGAEKPARKWSPDPNVLLYCDAKSDLDALAEIRSRFPFMPFGMVQNHLNNGRNVYAYRLTCAPETINGVMVPPAPEAINGTLPYSELKGATIEHSPVKAPLYYTWIPGIECKEVSQHFSSMAGQALQYLWRHGKKNGVSAIEDLHKARECLTIEIQRLEGKR